MWPFNTPEDTLYSAGTKKVNACIEKRSARQKPQKEAKETSLFHGQSMLSIQLHELNTWCFAYLELFPCIAVYVAIKHQPPFIHSFIIPKGDFCSGKETL